MVDLWSSLDKQFGWALVALTILAACSASASTADPPARALRVPASRPSLPDGFNLELVTRVESPTALAFTPDGRMLITTQPGRLLVWENGSTSLALDLSASTCTRIEQGMVGIAVDPHFAENGSIYIFYTYTTGDGGGCVNRVSRFTLGSDLAETDERVLIDGIPSPKGNHNAGDLNFGPDGNLYVSTGDGGCDYDGDGCNGKNDASRDRNVLLGKIIRITPDGGVPPDNPFTGPGSDSCRQTGRTEPGRDCRETYARGLRNPYRFAFDPGGTRLHINDVGQDAWEEIDEGAAGADYGWNTREGHCATGSVSDCSDGPAAFTEPIFDYATERRGGCHAITGGAFVPAGIWPEPYGGRYLFGDFGCGAIFRLVEDEPGEQTAELFAGGFAGSGIVHLEFGPFGASQALYFTSYEDGGAVYRISYGASR